MELSRCSRAVGGTRTREVDTCSTVTGSKGGSQRGWVTHRRSEAASEERVECDGERKEGRDVHGAHGPSTTDRRPVPQPIIKRRERAGELVGGLGSNVAVA